jgi:hypothetical protein
MSDRPTAEAVEAALQERFLDRRERGKWFRATPVEVRRAITERSIIDLYRPSEAGELAAASAAERRRLRRERRRASCRDAGRRYDPGRDRRGARRHRPHDPQLGQSEELPERSSRRNRNARRRFRHQNPGLWADLQTGRPELRSPFD